MQVLECICANFVIKKDQIDKREEPGERKKTEK